MIAFVQNLLCSIAARTGSAVLAVLEMAIMLRLLLIPAFGGYYKSTLLADALHAQVDQIYARAKNETAAARQTAELFAKVGYPSFGMISYALIFGLLGLLLGLSLRSQTLPQLLAQQAGPVSGAELVCLVPAETIRQAQSGPAMLLCALAPVLCAGSGYFHDRVFSRHSVVRRERFDLLFLLLYTGGSVFLPLGFSMFWICISLIGCVQSFVTRKFLHVSVCHDAKNRKGA